MLKTITFSIFVCIFTPISTLADAPQFSDYPVTEIYQGTTHPAIDEGRFGDVFPERQKVLENQKVNYAGHYIIYAQSCGKNCIFQAITDVKTGKFITYLGEYFCNDPQKSLFSIEYKPNSNLLILSGTKARAFSYPTQSYWIMDKANLKRLGYYDFYKIEHNEADFKKNCHDLNTGKKFDGASDFLCTYPNKTIKDIYNKLLNNSYDARLLHYPLPTIGKQKGYALKNDGDGLSISYEWLSKHSLKINILQFTVGTTNYTITEHKSKVMVQIHTEKKMLTK